MNNSSCIVAGLRRVDVAGSCLGIARICIACMHSHRATAGTTTAMPNAGSPEEESVDSHTPSAALKAMRPCPVPKGDTTSFPGRFGVKQGLTACGRSMASPPSWLSKHVAVAQPPSAGLMPNRALWAVAEQFKVQIQGQPLQHGRGGCMGARDGTEALLQKTLRKPYIKSSSLTALS
jgi:hypothetical protein